MSSAAFDGTRRVPVAANEPVRTFAPNSPETKNLKLRLDRMAAERVEIPIVIGGRRIHTGNTGTVTMPCVGTFTDTSCRMACSPIFTPSARVSRMFMLPPPCPGKHR